MYKYIEIVERGTDNVVERIDVTKHSERTINKTEAGMNINLNHADYFTRQTDSETELPKIES